jgi:hypothetical protein
VALSYYTSVAEAWLTLVTDTRCAKDFCTILSVIVHAVYQQCFQGVTPEAFMPASADAHKFQADLALLDGDYRKKAAERSGAVAEPAMNTETKDERAARPNPIRTRMPLQHELRAAESRTADPKLLSKLTAVISYKRYFEELKVLKAACKRYQTPGLLEQQFPDLDVWVAMADNDKADIANGEFGPGRFAWALVKRSLNLSGNDDRTLKNYRKALRAAKLL